MYPRPVTVRTAPARLFPAPLVLVVNVTPKAGKSFHHRSGAVAGNRAVYDDLNAFTWYQTQQGWRTQNHARLSGKRGLNGAEDATCRKRD